MKRCAYLLFAALFLLAGLGLQAQDEPPAAPPAAAGGRGQGGRGGGAGAARGPQAFDQVIYNDTKAQSGVFTLYVQKDRTTQAEHYFFAIPTKELDKDYLWVSTIAKTPFGEGYGGDQLDNLVVRFVRHDNTILLKEISYQMVADPTLPIATAVNASNNDAIIMAFPIEAFGKEQEPVIDVTRLYSTDIPEFSPRAHLGGRGMDASRSFIERAMMFPTSVDVESTETFTAAEAGGGAAAAAPAGGGRGGRGTHPSNTVLMNYDLVKLPEDKMMPRLFDDRVGYFSIRQQDFGVDEHDAPTRTYITRWRLEKKDPSAAVSDPVKPIVYYIDPATPMKWRPYVRKAILDWQPAFEQAGFSNAIIPKDPPSPQEDPTWSAQDVRNSIIRWLPSTTENSVGPNIHDPRTGEILNADIEIYQNVMQLAQDWYFVQVGPLDPRAKTLPLPDDLEGRLIEYVIAHEIGHTLGFQHNMKSSSLYDAVDLRKPDFVHQMGHVATLMDYSRFNYVAQPEDKIAPEDLIPRIGPYDKWATHWGYAPIAGARTPDAEKPTLDSWTKEQDTKKYLRFDTAHANSMDEGENTEAVGDQDAIYSTGMGLKNMHRVMDMLQSATTAEPDKPYDRTAEVYSRLLGQWVLEMNHVSVIVGSVDSQDKHNDQTGPVFVPTPKAKQAAAVAFLNANAFATPTFLIRPSVTRLFEPLGSMDAIRNSQMSVLNRLLQDARIEHLVELQAEDGVRAYAPTQFLSDVRGGVWTELAAPAVTIDAYRRNLQDGYLDTMSTKLLERTATTDEERALARNDLKTLESQIKTAVPKAANTETRAHLEASIDTIDKALDPKFAPPEPAAGAAGGRGGRGGVTNSMSIFNTDPSPLDCWPDYKVPLGPGGGN